MKISLLFFVFFLFGCQHSESEPEVLNIPLPSKLSNIQIPAPPSFIPRLYEVQINSAPMPFHLAHCYVVWVNGKRIPLSPSDTEVLAQALNLPLDPPQEPNNLHDGKGWHKPLEIVNY